MIHEKFIEVFEALKKILYRNQDILEEKYGEETNDPYNSSLLSDLRNDKDFKANLKVIKSFYKNGSKDEIKEFRSLLEKELSAYFVNPEEFSNVLKTISETGNINILSKTEKNIIVKAIKKNNQEDIQELLNNLVNYPNILNSINTDNNGTVGIFNSFDDIKSTDLLDFNIVGLFDLFTALVDSEKKELLETFRSFQELINMPGNEILLEKLLTKLNQNNIDNSERMNIIVTEINKLSKPNLFEIKDNEPIEFKGKKKNIPDIQFYYLNDNKVKSFTSNVTKSADYKFEKSQNIIHPLKQNIYNAILNHYNSNELFDFDEFMLDDYSEISGITDSEILNKKKDLYEEINSDLDSEILNKKKDLYEEINSDLEKIKNIYSTDFFPFLSNENNDLSDNLAEIIYSYLGKDNYTNINVDISDNLHHIALYSNALKNFRNVSAEKKDITNDFVFKDLEFINLRKIELLEYAFNSLTFFKDKVDSSQWKSDNIQLNKIIVNQLNNTHLITTDKHSLLTIISKKEIFKKEDTLSNNQSVYKQLISFYQKISTIFNSQQDEQIDTQQNREKDIKDIIIKELPSSIIKKEKMVEFLITMLRFENGLPLADIISIQNNILKNVSLKKEIEAIQDKNEIKEKDNELKEKDNELKEKYIETFQDKIRLLKLGEEENILEFLGFYKSSKYKQILIESFSKMEKEAVSNTFNSLINILKANIQSDNFISSIKSFKDFLIDYLIQRYDKKLIIEVIEFIQEVQKKLDKITDKDKLIELLDIYSKLSKLNNLKESKKFINDNKAQFVNDYKGDSTKTENKPVSNSKGKK